jgi:hypothetical protein
MANPTNEITGEITGKKAGKDLDSLTQLIDSNPCSKCRSVKLALCKCKPMMGCAAEEEAENEAEEEFAMQQELERLEDILNTKEKETESETFITQHDFDTQEVSDLLSTNILTIDNDMALGTLSLRLLYNPGLLSGSAKFALQRYLDTILRELEEFKKEHGISSNCISYIKDSAGNILSFRINLPTYSLYEAFILQLSNKNILPTQNVHSQAKTAYQTGTNHFIPVNPLSMRLTPYNRKKRDEEEKKSSVFMTPRLLPTNLLK